MRILLSGLMAAALLTSHMAQAQNCARPADKTAFDVAGLKSQLMVTAITCEATDRYNAFIGRYRPELLGQEKVLNAYFGRTYGKRGQAQHDDYVTSLANSQSQEGLKAGNQFCKANVPMFDEVMALRAGSDLTGYATTKASVQPAALDACTGAAPNTGVRKASATTGKHKKK